MSEARALVKAVKRQLGLRYRAAQRACGHVVFERGLHSTEQPDVSSGHLCLRRGLWGSKVGPGDVLLDNGSGRGRIVLHAARLPFARVIGLDLDEQAMSIARANVERVGSRPGFSPIQLIAADAASWQVPDEVTFIYMFNPFGCEVLRDALERIVESLDRRPRPLRIIYANPRLGDQVLATGRFTRARVSRGFRPDRPRHRVDVCRATGP